MTEEKKKQPKKTAETPKKGSTVVKKHSGASRPKKNGSAVVKKQAQGKHVRKEPENWDDLFLDEPVKKKKPAPHSRSARRAKVKRRARMKRTVYGTLSMAFAAVCILIIAFGAISTTRYFDFLEMRALLDRNTFYPGTVVDGVDLSGYTLPDALELFREREFDHAGSRSVTFDLNGEKMVYPAEELGFGSNYAALLRDAWEIGREGALEDRYAQAQAGCNYTISRGFDENILRRKTYDIAASLTKDSVDASIAGFTYNYGRYEFNAEQPGTFVDSEELFQQTVLAVASGEEVVIRQTIIEPEVTVAELSTQYGELAVAVTNASSSNDNRISNIRLACSSINCMMLEPGEEFSFNGVVGQRTRDAGYKKAGVYISGEVGEEIGGGICQVSTTLFNAVVKADLEVVERHNHSLPVSYVDNGKDATVNWGSQDFRFVNSSDEPIYIVAYVTDDWRIRTHIFGKLRTDGLTVSLVPVLQDTIKPGDDEYRYTDDLPTGQTRVKSKARNGYRLNTYKAYTDENGNVVDKVFLCSSYYPPRGAIIEVGR